jgi:hypothetical protein
MNSDKLKKVEEIYHAALEIPSAKRKPFLAESCGEDIDLRREVESLLSFQNSSDNIIENSPELIAAEMFAGENEINCETIIVPQMLVCKELKFKS